MTAHPLAMVRDGLVNLVSRMGTGRDKRSASFYAPPVITDDQLLNAYRSAWLPRAIVDIPAFDACRAWRDWQAEGDQIELIEAEETRLNLRAKVLEARIKARLWGGAALYIGVDQPPGEPLEPGRVGKDGLKYLTVISRRQLQAGDLDMDPASEWFGKPSFYRLSGQTQELRIHPSRLVLFRGGDTGGDDLSLAHGWGDSVLLPLFEAIANADGAAANIASMVFEAKVDVIRIPRFMESLGSPGYEQRVLDRLTLANTAKGVNGALLLDKEEEYDTKGANFANLPEVLDRFWQAVSGGAQIPMTRLLGRSPAGMNATGESDLNTYYDRIAASQAMEMTPAMARLDECLVRSALGARDPAVYFEWAPLYGMSEKEKAEVFKMKADAARVIAGTGGASPTLIPIDALSDALVNTLTEDGSLPGLEAAIEEYGKLSEQPDEGPDAEAAMTPAAADLTAQPQRRMAANDAEPRTLYVSRKLLNAAEFIAWAKGQGFETTLPADELHVTVAYSRQPLDWMKIGEDWTRSQDGTLTVAPGGARLVEPLGSEGAVVLLFNSSELAWRHMAIREAGASWDHDQYQPHVTITYRGDGVDLAKIEPYRGQLVFGPEIFAEVQEGWSGGLTEDGGQADAADPF